MATLAEKTKKLNLQIADTKGRLSNSKTDEAKRIYTALLHVQENKLAGLSAQNELLGLSENFKAIKQAERAEKQKAKAITRRNKLENKLKDLYLNSFGVTIEIKTVTSK